MRIAGITQNLPMIILLPSNPVTPPHYLWVKYARGCVSPGT